MVFFIYSYKIPKLFDQIISYFRLGIGVDVLFKEKE